MRNETYKKFSDEDLEMEYIETVRLRDLYTYNDKRMRQQYTVRACYIDAERIRRRNERQSI